MVFERDPMMEILMAAHLVNSSEETMGKRLVLQREAQKVQWMVN